MKVLLIGFSKQSAGVLNLLIGRSYPEYEVVEIDRCFGGNMRLCLPTIREHKDAAVLVINLEGVGMMGFSESYIGELTHYIGRRAALLIIKGDVVAWQKAQVLPREFATYLKCPYNKDETLAALETLFFQAKQISDHAHEFYQGEPMDCGYDEPYDFLGTASAKKVGSGVERHVLHRVLDKHFQVKQTALLHEFADIILEDGALRLTAGSQTIYMDKAKNLALVCSMERLMDYCSIANNFQVLTDVIVAEPINQEDFDKMANTIPHNGYLRYPLNTLLWQMYARILPERVEVAEHDLKLKMRFMPNFSMIKDTPEYVHALVSSCLVAPRSVDELSGANGFMIVDKSVINRVFLLAILSGTADFGVLEASFAEQEMPAAPIRTENAGVQKAQKTGFLRRLLSKLTGK
ncbi:MAG: hypothetical protein Q4B88_05795 [Moraxella sp.]|nr:hypothetical protein [Moraxella sp.]